jgi:cysteinyl-tRNA synthetase
MAKSVGNIALLHEVIEQYGAEAVVMYLLSGHYRQPLAFSESVLAQAQANVSRIRELGRKIGRGPTSYRDRNDEERLEPLRDMFFTALGDDFNTPAALASLYEWIRGAARAGVTGDEQLHEMLAVLGLQSLLAPDVQAPAAVRELAGRRRQARAQGDFAAADALREEIATMGWTVRDVPDGFELLPR